MPRHPERRAHDGLVAEHRRVRGRRSPGRARGRRRRGWPRRPGRRRALVRGVHEPVVAGREVARSAGDPGSASRSVFSPLASWNSSRQAVRTTIAGLAAAIGAMDPRGVAEQRLDARARTSQHSPSPSWRSPATRCEPHRREHRSERHGRGAPRPRRASSRDDEVRVGACRDAGARSDRAAGPPRRPSRRRRRRAGC